MADIEIPTYQDLFVPTLQALSGLGGSGSNDEVDQATIDAAD
jgi:hypothetical protein